MAGRTLDSIAGMKPHRIVSHLRPFLGLCNVYCCFVPNFAQTVGLLTAILKKEEPFRFGSLSESAEAAFSCLKQKIPSPPVLALSRHDLPYILDPDGCDIQVSCVLMQPDDGNSLRPVGNCSRTMCNAERNNDTTERQSLAIV